jgi:crotonobetainyl-CoA:carnitine CoA-transferase CaiB-like acyl-CoA transferase
VRSEPLREWEEIFAADHDVCAEVHRSGHEVLEHPQLVADHAVVEISDPERGDILQPAALINMSRTPAVIGAAAPLLGNGATVWRERDSVPPMESASTPSGRLPLEGVVVLELASMIAAPYGATLLTDFGARVIKVERLGGDPVRLLAAFPEAAGARVTQGKESIAVDISRPEGVEIVQKIAARADAVLEGFREGAADRHNLGATALFEINPNLIYLSARGYGTNGPYADRPAFGTSFGAASGIAAANLGGTLPEDPNISIDQVRHTSNLIRASAISRYAQTDGTSALVVATALLLGLYARQRGYGGQELSTSMLNSSAHLMVDHVLEYSGNPGGVGPGRDMRGPHALYRMYDSADGYIFLAAVQEKEWVSLADVVKPYIGLADDARFSTPAGRQSNDTDLTELLAAVFAKRTGSEWQRDLLAADVACVEVTAGFNEPLLMSEEFGRASGYIVDVHHPVFEDHPRLSPAVRFSRSETQAKPGVLCGSATDAVLQELGYTTDDIDTLRAAGVIG